jgi:predicted DNA-binding transcriptional regulator AlpA
VIDSAVLLRVDLRNRYSLEVKKPMTHHQDEPPKIRRLHRKEQAKAFFGNPADSTWYAMIAKGKIPAPVKLGELRRSVALWAEDELVEAQERLIKEREERVIARSQRPAGEIYDDIKLAPAPAVPKAEPPPLSPVKAAQGERNRRIATLWSQGWTKQRIARELGISTERVRQILTKAGAKEREVA